MDVPTTICETVDLESLTKQQRADRKLAASRRSGQKIFFRFGDDLVAFPGVYLISLPELSKFGCLNIEPSPEFSFAFWASDMAPTEEWFGISATHDGPLVAPNRSPDDFIIVGRIYYGPHADWQGMSTTMAKARSKGKSGGFRFGLENFSIGDTNYYLRTSEDRGVLIWAWELPNSPAPYPKAYMYFQNSEWSAAVTVPARIIPRWETVYNLVETFIAKRTVKGYFKR